MARNQLSQPQRTQANPLVLGTFSETAVRSLHGSLGPKNRVIGYADTFQNSNGGFGGGTYNHWFQINIEAPAWIILVKGAPRPNYIQVSAYDLDKIPIEGNAIFEADSLATSSNGQVYIPYLDTVMNTQSDLYNQFSSVRLDRGDERYYPLEKGSYLICISSTRNEPIDYNVAVVVEFQETIAFFELEDEDGSVALQESTPFTENIISPIAINTTVLDNSYAFTDQSCIINNGVTVTIQELGIWYIGTAPANEQNKIILEPGDDAYFDTIHDHSLSAWKQAWENEHHEDDSFPSILVPLTNRP